MATHILILARMDQLHESLDNPGFVQPLQGKEQERKAWLGVQELRPGGALQEGEPFLSFPLLTPSPRQGQAWLWISVDGDGFGCLWEQQ